MIGTKTEIINFLINQGKDNIRYKLSEYRQARTLKQNSYLHCIFQIIAEKTWYSREEIKEIMKAKFLKKYDDYFGIEFVQSTKELDTKEMTVFIDKIRQFALEYLDLDIPSPDDQRMLDFYNDYFFK